jgi:signal transduction histidine kinase
MLRVGIIGTGFGMYGLLPAFGSLKNCQVVSICGKGGARLDRFCKKYKVKKVYANWQEMLEKEDLVKQAVNSLETGAPVRVEYTVRLPEGRFRLVRSFAHVIFDSNKKPVRFVGVARDVTEESEEEAKALYRAKMASIGEMAAGIAHEINNPLMIIDGKLMQVMSLAKKGELSPDAVEKNIALVMRTSARIAKIVRGLRAFSRDGEMDPFEVSPWRSIVDETLAFCETRFKNHSVDVQVGEVPDSFVMECRPVQVSQVLLNLLNNAFDAVDKQDKAWIRVEVIDRDEYYDLEVSDSGSGVTDEVRRRILMAFSNARTVGASRGLGLSIVNTLVKSHGGNLTLDVSKPHTCFVARFPKVQNDVMALGQAG